MLRSKKQVRQRSQESERSAAKVIGGRVRPGSGAIVGFKGDVISPEYLLEDKVTVKDSYSLKLELWRKIRGEAFRARRKPVLRINFEDRQALYVIDEQTWIALNSKNNVTE